MAVAIVFWTNRDTRGAVKPGQVLKLPLLMAASRVVLLGLKQVAWKNCISSWIVDGGATIFAYCFV